MTKQKDNSFQSVLENKIGQTEEEATAVKTVIESKHQRPSRKGKKLIAGHFDKRVSKQLKLLAVEEDTTVQALLMEAVNLLFVKKGLKEL